MRIHYVIPLLVALSLPGCGGGSSPPPVQPDPDEVDCGDPELVVEAEAWVRELTDVHRFAVRIDPATPGIVEVDVISESNEVLATLREEQLYGDEEYADGTMRLGFQHAGEQLTVHSQGRELTAGYEVSSRIESGESSVVIDAVFERKPCGVETDGDGPECAGAIDITQAGVALPSCGLPYRTEAKAGLSPTLRKLRYRAESSGAEHFVIANGVEFSAVTAVQNAEQGDLDAVSSWLETQGLNDLVGSPSEELFSIVHNSLAWRDAASALATRCYDPATPQPQALTRCQALEDGRFRTLKQTQCGNGGGRDIPGWATGGELPGSPKATITCGTDGCSTSWGDPHLTTFDGHHYDFQGAGEYTLVETLREENPWRVQARYEPAERGEYLACSNVSIATALATDVGDSVIEIREGGVLLLDGAAASAAEIAAALPAGTSFSYDDDEVAMQRADGTVMTVTTSGSLDIDVEVPPALSGLVTGLFGNFDGTPENDFQSRFGQSFELSIDFEDLYGAYGNSWRVQESLFTYEDGMNSEDFTIADFPDQTTSFDDVPADVLQAAAEKCNVQDTALVSGCVLDEICLDEGAEDHRDKAPSVSNSEIDEPGLVLRGQVSRASRQLANVREAQNLCGDAAEVEILLDGGESVTIDEEIAGDSGTIPAGSEVRAWTLSLGHGAAETRRTGSVTFPQPILAVFRSDDALGMTPGGAAPGIEDDDVAANEDPETLRLDLWAPDETDTIRVFTEVSP